MAQKRSFDSYISHEKDPEGYTYQVRRCTLANGEMITFAPEFKNIGVVLRSIDKLKLECNDIVLVSYPKSGSHWMYEILQMLKTGHARPSADFKTKDFIELSTCIEELNEQRDNKVINTHIRPKYLPAELLSKPKIVHIVRNPKSIAVSYFCHTLQKKQYEYSGTFRSYLPILLKGCHTLYGNWFEYMQEWWNLAKSQTNIYTIFYEDIKKDPETELAKLSKFLGFNHDDEFLSQVNQMSSFETMKEGVGKSAKALQHAAAIWKDGKNCVVRKGSIEDWKNYFTVSQNEMFDGLFIEHMADYPDLKSRIQFE